MPFYIVKEARFSVQFEELHGWPRWKFTEDGFDGTRKFKVLWDDAIQFSLELKGNVFTGPIGTTRILPNRFPKFPRALCLSAEAEPFGKIRDDSPDDEAVYTHAEIIAQYRVPDNIDEPSPEAGAEQSLITETIEPSAEFLTIPDEGKLFYDDAQTDPVSDSGIRIGRVLVEEDWVYTIHLLARIPFESFPLIGRVNDKAAPRIGPRASGYP